MQNRTITSTLCIKRKRVADWQRETHYIKQFEHVI
jgi:hypothetical protein